MRFTETCSLFLQEYCKTAIPKEISDNKQSLNFAVSSDTHLAIQLNLLAIIEVFFRLLSPFAPYLSEELWQRLPKHLLFDDIQESIVVSPYPTNDMVSVFRLDPSANQGIL